MTRPALPRWLQAQVNSARAPQKAPPSNGALRVEPHHIPLELRHHDAWACWRYQRDNDRWSKPPYNPETGDRAEPSDSNTWAPFDLSLDAYRSQHAPTAGGRSYDGVSFALDLRWGIVGIDLDHVADHRRDAEWIIDQLDSYTEWSPSGDGFRIFLRGTLPEGRRRRDWVEMYSQRRFLTVTGHHVEHTPTVLTTSRHLYAIWQRYLQHG